MLHAEYPPFPGLTDAGLQFLRDLRQNNDRAWFKERKPTFEDEVRDPVRCLVADFAREAAHAGLPLTGDPKRSLFRIYRDTRFSKDKQPYKTHVGVVLSRSGGKKDPGGVYVHVEPGDTFVAGGYWAPEPPLLRRWRSRMAEEPGEWLEVVARLEGAGLTVAPRASLKRMPRGFEGEADSDVAGWLKAKGIVARRDFHDEALQTPSFTGEVVAAARQMLPLLEYGWDLLDAVPAP